jgi:hypothetical protein
MYSQKNSGKNFWENLDNYLCLYSMTNHVIDTYVKNFLTYRYKDWYWVINPSTNEWVVSVGNTGYTFFNNKFWSDFSMFYPVKDLTKTIQDWVLYKLNSPISEHCYPDYINGDYDWRDEFDIKEITEVINKGELVSS